jgi:hypothetical protein
VERQGHAHLRAGKKEITHWEVRTRLNVAVRVTRDQRPFADATKSLLGLFEKLQLVIRTDRQVEWGIELCARSH